jgi:ornithine cyclodeaminase
MLLAPGLVPGIPAYSVKVHAKFPGSDPAIRGVLVLHDLATDAPLAIMESSHLTALRTALAGALGADVLARPDATCLAIIGAGAQGRSQLEALRLVRPIRTVRVLDPSPDVVARFLAHPGCADLETIVAASLEEALDGADITVTATWAREPFLFQRHLREGLHVTTLGPDQPGKCEVAADALRAAMVVVDDRRWRWKWGQWAARASGEVIHAELGEVIAGTRPAGQTGRRDLVRERRARLPRPLGGVARLHSSEAAGHRTNRRPADVKADPVSPERELSEKTVRVDLHRPVPFLSVQRSRVPLREAKTK